MRGGNDLKDEVNHPIFSRFYILSQGMLEKYVGPIRAMHNSSASGRTLVIGAGTGLDIQYIGENVKELVLVEPDPAMAEYLKQHYAKYQVVQCMAEHLSMESEQFDTVLTSLVLCSVDQVGLVLEEIARVLKPGGQYLFFEHVAHDHTVPRFIQNALNPMWSKMAGGCMLNRDIVRELQQSTLELTEYRIAKQHFLVPMVVGRALKS